MDRSASPDLASFIDYVAGLDQVCSSHAETFLQAGITGRQLLCMNHHDLEHLGVEKFGHQELILEGIELLSRLVSAPYHGYSTVPPFTNMDLL